MDRSRSSGYYIFEFLKKWQFTFVRVFLKQKGISDWCDSPRYSAFKCDHANNNQNAIVPKSCFQFALCLLIYGHSNKILSLKFPVFQDKGNFHKMEENF